MKDTMKRNADLLNGSVKKHLFKMTLPTIGGMLAFSIFNLTDTYFVSKLGTESLAAMGFTFPVAMVVGSIASGMSLGAGSALARAMGRKDHHLMSRIVTDGILLSIISVIIISIIGLLTRDPLFTLLGADATTLPLVKEYMTIWYICVGVVIMPPVGDASMRAMGDMLRPSIVMITCAIVNVILDPILIFGLFGLPAMGIKGAAIATVISRFVGMITTLSFVHFHYGLIDFKYESFKDLINSWKQILYVGVPGIIIRLFPQLLRGTLTSLTASIGGMTAVAAIAAGTKIESFATIISMSVGSALIPLVGQNWGAEKYERVNDTRKFANKVAVGYGLLLFILAIPFAASVSSIFTDSREVMDLTKWYLIIMMLGSIGMNLYNWNSQSLNSAKKPRWVMIINIVVTCTILIPSAVIGVKLYGYIGMLVGLCVGQLTLGGISTIIGKVNLQNPSKIS